MSENIDTLVDVSPPTSGDEPEESPQLSAAEQDTIRELVRQARASGAALTDPDGLPKQLTKMVVEAALPESSTGEDSVGGPLDDENGCRRTEGVSCPLDG